MVTGASGHIGANLVRTLMARQRPLKVLVHEDTRALEGLDVETAAGDLLDLPSLVASFAGADVVYHLAARISIAGDEGGRVHSVNVSGTRNIVTACLECGVRRLIHFSSIHALSQKPLDVPVNESRPRQVGGNAYPYDHSKALAEQEALAGLGKGLEVVVVIPTAVIGPHDYKISAMGEVLLDLYHQRLPALVNGGFDWVDVRDVVEGAILAEEKGRSGEQYLLAGNWLTLRDLSRIIEKVTGVPAPRKISPMWAARLAAPLALKYSRIRGKRARFTPESLAALRANRHVDCCKAKQDLGYTARPIHDTIQDTFHWFKTMGKIGQP